MSELSAGADPALSKHRLEALSDGVFAVVLTLLVLELKPELPPHADDEAVAHALRELAMPLLGYIFAFTFIGIFWLLHHRKFTLLRHTNGLHSVLTLVFLFTVSLEPLSISIYLRSRPRGLAQAMFYGNFALIAITLLASWLYARRAGLADLSTAPQAAAALTRRMVSMTFFGVIASVSAWSGQGWILMFALPVLLWLRFRRLPGHS